ncbi:MAG: lipid II flippase MurJ, partial [Vicinamibacterales bacterium]
MVSTMVYFGGGSSLSQLAEYLAWGAVVGSALQFGVQLPVVLRVAPDLRFAFDTTSEHVRTIVRNFVPAFISRGVSQL